MSRRLAAWRAAALVAACLTAGTQLHAQGSPVAVVESFYAAYAQHRFTGLPTGESWQRITRYVSAPLAKMIRAAQSEQARCLKAHPDDKPPWIEGDMFSSNFEGFTAFRVADSVEVSGTRRVVTVEFTYVDRGQTTSWRDRVVVAREAGHWAIDDVRYRTSDGFGNGFGESLRQALELEGAC